MFSAFGTLVPLYIVDFPDGNERVVALSAIFEILGEVPMLLLSRRVIDRLGYVRCLYLACFAFIARSLFIFSSSATKRDKLASNTGRGFEVLFQRTVPNAASDEVVARGKSSRTQVSAVPENFLCADVPLKLINPWSCS